MKKAKRILALLGVILLVLMYLVTLVLALMASPSTKNMLMAAIGCTIVIPCLIYAMTLIARVLENRGSAPATEDKNTSHK